MSQLRELEDLRAAIALGEAVTFGTGTTVTDVDDLDAAYAAEQVRLATASSLTSAVESNTQEDDYTLEITDAGLVVEMDSASANTITIPPNDDVAFPVGTIIEVCQVGAGTTTIEAGAGVTIRSAGDLTDVGGQWSSVGLRQRAVDEWVLTGDRA